MDFGNLVGQILPLIIVWILFPIAMLILYFYVRGILNRRKREQAALAEKSAAPAASSFGGVNALDMLRQAQPDSESPPAAPKYDTGELPDLDLLLSPKPPQPEKSSVAVSAPKIRVADDGTQRVQLHTGQITAAKEVLTVLRDEHDNRLMVQIGTTGYRTLLDSPEAKKEFTRLMKELSGIIMTPDDAVLEEDMPEIAHEDKVGSLGDLLSAKPAPMPEPAVIKKTTPPPPPPTGQMPGDLPSYKFDDNPANIQFGRTGVKKVEFTPPPAVDIPSAIEAYLQYKIQYTPEYQGRNIHVKPAPGGGVRIQVGDVFFDAVDEINDIEVRHFLQETIAEWQQRQ